MAGPATNVATIGAVAKTLGRRALALYLATIIIGSVAFGLLFTWLLAGVGKQALLHEHGHPWWSIASAVVLLGLTAHFALNELHRRLTAGGQSAGEQPAGDECHSCASDDSGPTAAIPTGDVIQIAIDGMHLPVVRQPRNPRPAIGARRGPR